MGLAALALAGCRIREPGPRWVEPHGQGQFKAIAASSRGLTALGKTSGVYRFPGDFGRPWVPIWHGVAIGVAATDVTSFGLTATGELWRLDRSASLWRTLPPGATALYRGANTDLLAVVDGHLVRVGDSSLEKFACAFAVRSASSQGSKTYVVKADGSVWLAEGERCDPVDIGGAVDELAATIDSLYILRAGRPFVIDKGRAVALPLPIVIRADKRREVHLQSLAASARMLWALSTEGSAFQLLDP
jgi:hypothetical protein